MHVERNIIDKSIFKTKIPLVILHEWCVKIAEIAFKTIPPLGYWGPRCQYKDECVTDNDCGTGKCIDIESTALPRKQCFCYTGFHGEHCQLQNKVTLPKPENLELSSHNMTAVTDRIKLYYRVSWYFVFIHFKIFLHGSKIFFESQLMNSIHS